MTPVDNIENAPSSESVSIEPDAPAQPSLSEAAPIEGAISPKDMISNLINKIEIEGGKEDASSLRSNQGQFIEGREDLETGEDTSSENIQLQAQQEGEGIQDKVEQQAQGKINKPRKYDRSEINKQSEDFLNSFLSWIKGTGPKPSEPSILYRGTYEENQDAKGDYIHVTPWLRVADAGGKIG